MQRTTPVWRALLLSACMACAPATMAAGPTAPASVSDPEEKIDEGLKGFGYVAGLSLGCVATERRPALEREVMDLHAEISRLLGIDRAFLFTAAFGHGTGVQLKTEDSKGVLARHEGRVSKFRLGRPGK